MDMPLIEKCSHTDYNLINTMLCAGLNVLVILFFLFLPAENSQKVSKMCKGLKAVPGIPQLHTQICSNEMGFPTPVPNCNEKT